MGYATTIVITGTSSGLGYDIALQIAKARPNLQIVVCSRTAPETADKINTATGGTNVSYLKLDLASHADTRSFVKQYLAKDLPPISALILNAGVQFTDKVHTSPDGLEAMFAINHVNQALLLFLLRPQLLPDARIVLVASGLHDPNYKYTAKPHYTTAEAIAHPPSGEGYENRDAGMKRYAESKLCNILFGYALHDRSSYTVLSMDPGVMATGLYRAAPGMFGTLFRWSLNSFLAKLMLDDMFETSFSAATVTKLALDPEYAAREKSGKYYTTVGAKEVKSSEQSHDKALQKDLWEWTINEVGQGGEKTAFQKA